MNSSGKVFIALLVFDEASALTGALIPVAGRV